MRYREIPPRPPLNSFVECFWTLEGDGPALGSPPERILPDGCVELILNFGDRFSQHDNDARELQPRHFLVGQMSGPILISPNGAVQLLGIRFHPGGTSAFVRVPMNEVTDRIAELGGLSSELEQELLRVSECLPSLRARIAAVEGALIRRLLRGSHDSPALRLAARVVQSAGLISVDQLATDAGISSRQLERRFLREIGVGPKLLGRILRFQQVFRAVERLDAAWASIAVECGYYDQAHLIRDFNQFAGQTPSVLLAEKSSLTNAFTRKARTSHFSNTGF
ncbi:MAG TPA: AraC family transcriptional regulator [Pyrinomonadaceae bacterium]|jgi:AraC-like DNA-binding protein|nr:AraC family transcriptional regulator [Pyrinomonadaceae bacterium]